MSFCSVYFACFHIHYVKDYINSKSFVFCYYCYVTPSLERLDIKLNNLVELFYYNYYFSINSCFDEGDVVQFSI